MHLYFEAKQRSPAFLPRQHAWPKRCWRRRDNARLDTSLGANSSNKQSLESTQTTSTAEREPGKEYDLRNDSTTASPAEQEGLPRGAVFNACIKTTLGLSAAGVLIRAAASPVSALAPWMEQSAVQTLLSNPLEAWHAGVVVALVAGVTSGRLMLLKLWPDYATASDRSNRMVLDRLTNADLMWVSFLPGFSEELLFRGALVPLLGADWKAVLVSGVVFGALHRQGGRNWAFAAWAVAVGCAYGASYVYTGDLLVPAGAHSLANLAAAVIWVKAAKVKGT